MAIDQIPGAETSITQLVSGIINDAQDLTRQQFALFQSEVRDDLTKTKEAALSLAVGAGVALLGILLLCFMLVHLLAWAVPTVPLWTWFGVVGGVLALMGAALIYAGRMKFESFNPLPDQTVRALRENVQWKTNPR